MPTNPLREPKTVSKLENKLPEDFNKGIYAWDDKVTEKINELVDAVNAMSQEKTK